MTEFFDGWDYHYKTQKHMWAGAVHDRLKLKRGGRVLEAGCGNGKLLQSLLKEDVDITAFDISENAISLCRGNIHSDNIAACARLLTADCRNLPFRDSVFDEIIYRHVSGHLDMEGRKRLAIEAKRVLKDDGKLFFTGFSVEDMRAGKGIETEYNSFLKGNGIMTHYFSEEEVRELFSGLKEVSVNTVRWSMRVRNIDHTRAEVKAVFRKVNQ